MNIHEAKMLLQRMPNQNAPLYLEHEDDNKVYKVKNIILNFDGSATFKIERITREGDQIDK